MGAANERDGDMKVESDATFRMSDELVRKLRERVASQYYDRPQVIDIIARAILQAHGLYPS